MCHSPSYLPMNMLHSIPIKSHRNLKSIALCLHIPYLIWPIYTTLSGLFKINDLMSWFDLSSRFVPPPPNYLKTRVAIKRHLSLSLVIIYYLLFNYPETKDIIISLKTLSRPLLNTTTSVIPISLL
jgi:hypothetical protein